MAGERAIEAERGWLTGLRWSVAAAAIVAAHAAGAYVLLATPADTPPPGAPQAPILIELAPPAAAPEIAAVEPTPEPVTEETPEPVVEPTPEPVVEEVVEPEPEPVVEPEPLPEPEPVVEPEPEPELPAIANAPIPMARPTPPRPRPQQQERPRETRTAERRQVEPPPPRRQQRETQRPREQRRQQAAPSVAAQGERRREVSQGAQSRPSVSPARWQSQVQARLNRFKRTPRGGGRGTAQLSFSMDANGAVTGARLVRSAGNAALDEAAVALVRRASPFPAPPNGAVSLSVPIRFD